MSLSASAAEPVRLSVVIPTYNSAPCLPSTIAALADAVRTAAVPVQLLIIDDGSEDDTTAVVDTQRSQFPGGLELIRQTNRGRFLARWEGLARATGEYVLLLDSRVLIDPGAIAYLLSQLSLEGAPTSWTAHVRTDTASPLVGRFWDVPTYIFWGEYLRRPRPYTLTENNFDRAPKGTTAFLARTATLRAAFQYAWPEGDAKLVSDDTKVLRWIAANGCIRLDPRFSAVYRPRTTLKGFMRHTFDRGTLFVDSYAGTSALRSGVILTLAVAPPLLSVVLIVLACTGSGVVALAIIAATVLLAVVPIVPAALNNCPPRSVLAYVCCLPAFVLPFWAGLVRGTVIHRRAFGRRASAEQAITGMDHA